MSKVIRFIDGERSFFTIPNVPRAKILGGSLGVKGRRDIWKIKFIKNCIREGCSADELSILFGYTLGKTENVFIGWRYSSVSKNFDIYLAYTTKDGAQTERFLMSADMNKAYIITLDIDYLTSCISIECITALDRGYRMRVAVHTGGMGLSDGPIFNLFPKWCLSKSLSPTIGKLKKDPIGEVEIVMERI